MGLIELLLVLAIAGFCVWIIMQIPMPDLFKNVIVGVACFALLYYVLQSLGLIHGHWLRL